MSNYKRFQVGGGGGSFRKWTEPGQTLEGRWQGTKPGKFGDLGLIDTEHEGRVSFPIHTALVDTLKRVKIGAGLHICYKGMVTGKTGTTYKAFDVFVEKKEDLADDETSESEEVPF